MGAIVLLAGVINGLSFLLKKGYLVVLVHVVVQGLIYLFLLKYTGYYWLFHFVFYFIPSLIVGFIISVFLDTTEETKPKQTKFLVTFTSGKIKYYFDLLRGGVIFGTAGSGKTETGFVPIIETMIENRLSGIILDMKDFELAEIAYHFFEKHGGLPYHTFSPHRPEITDCINPIDPIYLKNVKDVRSLAYALVSNLMHKPKGDGAHFFDATVGAFAGVIWRLRTDFPAYCSLPYLTAFLTYQPYEIVAEFIPKSRIRSFGKCYVKGIIQ